MELEFKLTKEEAQKVLDCLVKEPYKEVHELINNINSQAAKQMSNSNDLNQK